MSERMNGFRVSGTHDGLISFFEIFSQSLEMRSPMRT